MTHKVLDRVRETTSTTGTGTLTLTGPAPGCIAVADATNGLTADGDTSWFIAENGTEWEMFLGTRVDATHLARTTLIKSSTGSAVSFAAPPVVFSAVPGAKLGSAGPAFHATRNSGQTLGSSYSKLTYTAEEYDTAGAFDPATGRFQPAVAGYYQLTARMGSVTAFGTNTVMVLYKNGAAYMSGLQPTSNVYGLHVSGMVYLNGSTDYAEAFVYLSAGLTTDTSMANNYFQGCLIRAA